MSGHVSSPALVGRERQVATLQAALAAAREGRPSLTLVGGEAGVGKTRLTREVARREREHGAVVLMGQCLELKGGEFPYAPIVGALREVSHPAFDAILQDLPPEGRAELARLIPELSDTTAPDPSPAGGRRFARGRLFEFLLLLLRQIGEHAPVLLLIEDAHWADRSTGDFLAFAVRNFSDARIALFVTYRSDELRTEHPLQELLAELIRCDGVQRIELDRLPREALELLLGGIAKQDVPQELIEEIFARSRGNPFFAEELLAARTAGEAGALPASLGDALLVRIDSLSDDAVQVLRALAVIGRPADQELLGAVAGLSEPALSRALRDALSGHAMSRADDDAFEFRHALVQEAVYADLLPGERKALHRASAEVLARLNVGSAELAFHLEAEGAGGPALVASLEAGLEAEHVYAFAEAREHFRRALRLWDEAATLEAPLALDRIDLLSHCAEATRLTGDWDGAVALCEEALALLDPDIDPRRAAALHERLGEYSFWDDEAALVHYGEAVRLLPAGYDAERARLLGAEALAFHYLQRWDEARERAEAAMILAGNAGARAEEAYARLILGTALAFLGDPESGEEHLRSAKRVAEALGNGEYVARAYAHLAEILRIRGRLAEALELMVEGEQVAERMGMSGSFGNSLSVMAAEDLIQLGRWDEAAERLKRTGRFNLRFASRLLQHSVCGQLAAARGGVAAAGESFERARDMCDEDVAVEYLAGLFAGRAELALWERRPSDARAEIADALGRIGSRDDPLYTPAVYSLGTRVEADLAERARALGNDAALDLLRQRAYELVARLDGVIAAHSLEVAPPEALAHRSLARAELSRLDQIAEPTLWDDAVQAWDALARPYPAAYARWRLAEALLLADADRSRAAMVLEEAREVAARLGATPLRQATEALARAARLPGRPSPRVTVEGGAERADPGLTAREHDVLALIAEGLTNRQIAERLFISDRTAGVHVSHILSKLGARNRMVAARTAQQLGLVDASGAMD